MQKVFDKKNKQKMNINHYYYYQVQGQLHVTQKKFCIFAVYTGLDIYWIKVERDDLFWENKMHRKLTNFYEDCILPEIIDPRFLRRMKLREPEYILEARKEKNIDNKKRQSDELDGDDEFQSENDDIDEIENERKRPRLSQNSSYSLTKYIEKIMQNVITNPSLRRVMLNGNINAAFYVTINGRNIYVVNTCPFDSYFELMVNGYEKFESFKNFINQQSEENKFFELIKQYVESNYNENLFYSRRIILFYEKTWGSRMDPSGTQIYCDTSANVIHNHLSSNDSNKPLFDCATQVMKCSSSPAKSCTYLKTINYFDITVRDIQLNAIRLLKSGYQNVEAALKVVHQFYNRSNQRCSRCKQNTMQTTFEFGSFIAINFEHLIVENNIKNSSQLPLTIKLENKEYDILGFIRYTGSSNGLGHFICYSYNKENKWEERDDTERNPKVLKDIPDDIQIAMAFYIKT